MRKLQIICTIIIVFYSKVSYEQISLSIGAGSNCLVAGYTSFDITSSMPNWGLIVEANLSYTRNHHYFSFGLITNFNKFQFKKQEQLGNNYFTYQSLNELYKTYQLPIIYGYKFYLKKNNETMSITPFIGFSNQIIFSRYDFMYSHYKGGFLGGVRIKLFNLYLNFSYLHDLYSDSYLPHFKSLNLSLGYVYTFKTKAERQAKK